MSNSTANLTVCEVCEPVYGELNRFYVHLEDESHHEVCMDIVDSVCRHRFYFWTFKYM